MLRHGRATTNSLQTALASSTVEPYNAAEGTAPSRLDLSQVVTPLGFLLLALTYTEARAQTRGGLGSSLDLLYLVVVEPLLPLLAGASLFMLTRSHLIAAGLSALGFGAWGALYFSRLSLDALCRARSRR